MTPETNSSINLPRAVSEANSSERSEDEMHPRHINTIEGTMAQNLDKKLLMNLIQSSKPLEMVYLKTDPTDKDSFSNLRKELEKFIGKSSCSVIVVRN